MPTKIYHTHLKNREIGYKTCRHANRTNHSLDSNTGELLHDPRAYQRLDGEWKIDLSITRPDRSFVMGTIFAYLDRKQWAAVEPGFSSAAVVVVGGGGWGGGLLK